MPSGKEIRNKIKSVENTRKITKAMEMVAASKMRKAQDRMRAARPMAKRSGASRAIWPTPSPNTSIRSWSSAARPERRPDPCHLRQGSVRRSEQQRPAPVSQQDEGIEGAGAKIRATCIGNKGFGFMQRNGVTVVSHVTGMGDTPHLEKLIGPVKVQLDAYMKGEIDALYISHPLHQHHEAGTGHRATASAFRDAVGSAKTKWDYVQAGSQGRHRRPADPLRRGADLPGRG